MKPSGLHAKQLQITEQPSISPSHSPRAADNDPGRDISPKKNRLITRTEDIPPLLISTGSITRLKLPDDSGLNLKTSGEQILEKLGKLGDIAEEVLGDIRSSPRARLVSKLDANVQNTQVIITNLKQKSQAILDAQDDDRLILKMILDGQNEDRKILRSLKPILEDISSKVNIIWGRIVEIEREAIEEIPR